MIEAEIALQYLSAEQLSLSRLLDRVQSSDTAAQRSSGQTPAAHGCRCLSAAVLDGSSPALLQHSRPLSPALSRGVNIIWRFKRAPCRSAAVNTGHSRRARRCGPVLTNKRQRCGGGCFRVARRSKPAVPPGKPCRQSFDRTSWSHEAGRTAAGKVGLGSMILCLVEAEMKLIFLSSLNNLRNIFTSYL